jgi:hypothetical protein
MGHELTNGKFSLAQIDRALFVLALAPSANAAARELREADDPLKVDPKTLRSWTSRYAERWREIQDRHAKKIRQAMANEQFEIAHAAGEAERLAISKTKAELRSGKIKDSSTAARNLAVSKGVAVDHGLKLRGEPTQIVQHRSAEEIVRSLKRLAPRVFDAEATAQEINEAAKELVDPDKENSDDE